MIEQIEFNQSLMVLEKALDAASLRHEVIANNIANVNTPGFKKASVSFEDELREALAFRQGLQPAVTHPKHIQLGSRSVADVKPKVVTHNDYSMRNDKNNVDIDAEMTELAKNNLFYNALTQLISSQFNIIKNAINEGRR